MTKIYFLLLILRCSVGLSQSTDSLPAACRKFPLRPNQTLSIPDFPGRYRLATYLDNGIINERSRDSLVTDSRLLLDLFLSILSDSIPCEMLQLTYSSRYSRNSNGVVIQYWLRHRKITRVDSLYDHPNELIDDFPLQYNQFANWGYVISSEAGRYLDNFNLFNIVPANSNYLNKDSLDMDSRKNLLRLLKHRAYLKRIHTNIEIFYVSQYGAKALYHVNYPLGVLKRNPNYYEILFGFSETNVH